MSHVANILKDAVDLHCHSGPSAFPRRLNHIEAARNAESVGMRAILTKCHHHSTVFDLLAMKNELDKIDVEVFGSVALNEWVGGVNPSAARLAIAMGARAIWFPTVSSAQHIAHHHADPNMKYPQSDVDLGTATNVSVFDDTGALSAATLEIIQMIAAADILMSPGHAHPDTVSALLTQATAAGVTKFVVNHPEYIVGADFETARQWASRGAIIEHCLVLYDEESPFKVFDFDLLLDWINQIGVDNTSLGSDCGQRNVPVPTEVLERTCHRLLESGVSEDDVRCMVVHNPTRLLGLAPRK